MRGKYVDLHAKQIPVRQCAMCVRAQSRPTGSVKCCCWPAVGRLRSVAASNLLTVSCKLLGPACVQGRSELNRTAGFIRRSCARRHSAGHSACVAHEQFLRWRRWRPTARFC